MMKRIVAAGVLAALGIGLGGCASDRYGRYGYGGYDGAYATGYADAGYGWYDGFYYPGSGFYVYDQYRRPYRWDGAQQRYWAGRAGPHGRSSWQGFDPGVRADYRARVSADRNALRAGIITPGQFRAERQGAALDARQANRALQPGGGPPRGFGRAPGGPRYGGGGHHGRR